MPDGPGQPPSPPCPICGRERTERYRPFCSRRCADVDLARWLGGAYAIPAAEDEYEDEPGKPDRDDGEEG
jgi:endogenous inhibitor of DNA gyrase (YacG/DUF329 family)